MAPRQGSAGYWFYSELDQVSPLHGGLLLVCWGVWHWALTYLTSLYFKIKKDRRKGGAGEIIQWNIIMKSRSTLETANIIPTAHSFSSFRDDNGRGAERTGRVIQ